MDSSSPDPSPIDSTRKLLQELRLRRANHPPMMDSMEMDLASEVPDTPERQTMPRAEQDTGRNFSSLSRRNIRSYDEMDSESIFLRGRIAASISNPSYPKLPHPTRSRTARRRTAEDNSVIRLIDSAERQGNDVTSNGSRIMPAESSSWHQRSSLVDKGKGISASHEQQPKNAEPKNFGPRRLVRNGLISPVNIANSSNVAKDEARVISSSRVRRTDDESSTSGRAFRGKRKPSPNVSNLAESSSSRNLERIVIDVDELPSPASRNGADFDSNLRAQQVMSDEIYARQLQEEFFNESSRFEEVDSSVAMSLLVEESDTRSSLVRDRSRSQSHRREPGIAHLQRPFPRRSLQNSRSNSTAHPRITPSARMSQLQRNLRRGMDFETRLNFLEALEIAFTVGGDYDTRSVLHLHRDFNENDYEMLLALDEDNHRHIGASVQQINNLPESVIQTGSNAEEPCTICLEPPSVGDTVRHLPCLHKFHKDCIDEWLRRKTSCPICKSGIS